MQPPAEHVCVQVPVVAHLNVQPPPEQENAQFALSSHDIVQPPPAQLYEHIELPLHCCTQWPPAQAALHTPEVTQLLHEPVAHVAMHAAWAQLVAFPPPPVPLPEPPALLPEPPAPLLPRTHLAVSLHVAALTMHCDSCSA